MAARANQAKKQLNFVRRTILQQEQADAVPESDRPVLENVAWLSQHYLVHSCKRMYQYILENEMTSPMSLAAVWRLIHCKKCGLIYLPRLAASPTLASYYVRFGGDLKLLHSKKPKLLCRDLPAVAAALREGVKADPRFRPGAVRSAADNQYLFEKLGDVAILAGMIDPKYVLEDASDPLLQRLLHFKAYDSVPVRVAYAAAIRLESDTLASLYTALKRIETSILPMMSEYPGLTNENFWVLIDGSLPRDPNPSITDYLYCRDADNNTEGNLARIWGFVEKYRDHVATQARKTIEKISKMYPDREVKVIAECEKYLSGDICAVLESSGKYVIISHYGEPLFDRKFLGVETANPKMVAARAKVLGKDWIKKPCMTALEIRSMMLEEAKQEYLRKLPDWTFIQFSNCDFDVPSVGAHPVTTYLR